MSEKRNAGLTFIFITLLIDVTGFGIIIPILPTLIAELVQGDLSTAARWGGLLMFIFSIMQFICAPIMGGLSDMFGRRPVLLATLFAFGLDFILQGLATTIWWLFIGRMIAGITGASFSTAGAYIADVSEPEKRAQNFGLIGAAFGIGFILGPVIGGFLGQFGSRVPFFASAGLALLNFTYGYFILPESLKPENRRPFDWKRANPLGTLLRARRYPVLLSLIGSLIFTMVFWTGIALLFIASGIHFWLTLLFVSVICALGAGKAWLRLKAVKLVLKDYEKELNRQITSHLILWTITPPLYFYNSVCALFSRKIVWRGIEYELKSATETVILSTK